ncbi:hypothetical protein [Roseibium alexandrii]|uniref:hypothetical protein n=1 Tax=Roseibium alexandrii TaxID=388408 RepID=UPI0037526938
MKSAALKACALGRVDELETYFVSQVPRYGGDGPVEHIDIRSKDRRYQIAGTWLTLWAVFAVLNSSTNPS